MTSHRPVTTFTLPDLGEGLSDAEIVSWHVGPGDRVVVDQPLVAVETDKAVVEIPSPRSGYIERLRAEEGAIVRVGQPLVDFGDNGPADAGALVGRLAPTPTTSTSKEAATAAAEPPRGSTATTGRATPAVRARAKRLGVDLSLVAGSGPGGTITAADVDAAAAGTVTAPPDIEPLRGARRSMAANMARAGREAVGATVQDVADVGEWGPAEDPTVRLIRAVGVASVAEPALNMTFHGPEVGRSANATVDLGVAVDTEDGLFVPVLRDVAARPPAQLRTELDTLMAAVADRSVAAEDLRGPTITLSNFGSMAGRHGVLVVMPPQVAIVGAGRIHDAVVARHGRPDVRPILPLSLTFDHRVITGGEAARFLSHLIADLEAPS